MRLGKFISVDGIRTHCLEAGENHRGRRPTVLLLHSAEYGGAAEFSWEFNLEALGKHYHVLAPDHLGFGLTDKIFDFNGQFDRRIAHIRRFIEVMGVGPVHVIGSSMSGGLSLTVAARKHPDWPILSIVCCSGGGDAPNNEQRKIINSYDGSREHMRRILQVMFIDPKWSTDEAYLARRWEMSLVPGGWEATSAARFKAPFRDAGGKRERDNIDYGAICVPTLVMAGKLDGLREPGYTDAFVPKIPRASLHVFERAGHMGNIECFSEFNARVLSFLNEHSPGATTGVADVQETFRLAMRRVASTVAIVSAQRDGERHGTTATSVTSISMDPPSVLVCFNQSSRLHEFLHSQDRFCVNVLHTANLDLAKVFSRNAPAEGRFATGDWRTDAEGVPYLADAQANLFCRKEQEITYGSHTIFIGRVLEALTRPDVSPLVYRDGRYGAVAPDAAPVE